MVRIAPQLGDLTFAKGTVPTPQGDITVRWERGAGGEVSGVVRLPGRITGEAEISGRTIHLGAGETRIGDG